MKTEHNNRFLVVNNIIKTSKLAAYFILLLLSYTLGYLSHSYSSPKLSPPLKFSHSTSPSLPPPSPQYISSIEPDPFRVKTHCTNPIPPEKIRRKIISLIFNGTSPFTDFPPPHAAEHLRRSKKIKGWGSNGAVFENLIRKVKPKIIVEVGTFLGASAVHMAELTQRFGLKTQILCIDDFRGWAGFRDKFKNIPSLNGDVLLYYQFLMNVVSYNHTGSVLPVPYSSGSALTKLCEWGVWADLVEIDAGHDFLSAWSDINRGFRILRPGGVIFGHDYFTAADNKGVRRAVDLFAKIHGLKVNIDGQHWVIYTTYIQ
ncbi:putative S-adenosyl-L-methionine-dependent methyltransferase [Medicago truncatula]|uniref:Methyltransferase, putative n=1 Tax=Medicago truncatula TaxID=3880 RepID=A0A072TMZ6_MEDTR|nr:uncharacterized protein LOC25500637 [Medicago truncatula]KEH18596.1 methyltransferase, putative [Medicago truncatula]RHN39653.1 putative S-adenosyl-L-methionine-dependent methyltransferase [Medicago truncatula]